MLPYWSHTWSASSATRPRPNLRLRPRSCIWLCFYIPGTIHSYLLWEHFENRAQCSRPPSVRHEEVQFHILVHQVIDMPLSLLPNAKYAQIWDSISTNPRRWMTNHLLQRELTIPQSSSKGPSFRHQSSQSRLPRYEWLAQLRTLLHKWNALIWDMPPKLFSVLLNRIPIRSIQTQILPKAGSSNSQILEQLP